MFGLRISKVTSLIYPVQSKSLNILSNRFQSDYTSHESSKFMKKLLNRNAKTKKKWFQPHLGEPNEVMGSFFKSGKKEMNETQKVRARQLSHVLYDKISDLINSDELSSEIVHKQVLITKVKMLDDFSGINVYWDCNRSDTAEVDTLLQTCTGKLRSLLISYHVLGRIPPVTFVKDKTFVDLSLLNQLFEVADYGPDYVPFSHQKTSSEDSQLNKSGETTNTDGASFPSKDLPSSSDTADIEQINNFSDNDTQNETEPFRLSGGTDISADIDLKFRSDIYGLPRDKLYQKVMAQKTKGRYKEPDHEDALSDALKEFESKQLNIQKDRSKLKALESSSSKIKQKRLENDFIEFQQEIENKTDES